MNLDTTMVPRPSELRDDAAQEQKAQEYLNRIANELRQHFKLGEPYQTTVPCDVTRHAMRAIGRVLNNRGWVMSFSAVMLSTGDSAWHVQIDEARDE